MNSQNFKVTFDVLASKEKRFANLIVDTIAYYAFFFVIGIILGVLAVIGIEGPLNFFETASVLEDYMISISVYLIYYTVFEVATQRTLGKYITKTMVVMEDGTKPTFKDSLIRSLCRLIPFEAFSFLGTEGKGWHDSMSDTFVVDLKKYHAKRNATNEIEEIGKSVID